MTVAYLLKHDKFGSNFVLIKQNLPNSIILPPKNGGFKARSHSVRKANCKVLPPRELFHPVLPCHTQSKLSFPVPKHVIRTLLPILTVKQPFREHGVAWSWRKPWKKVTKSYKFIRIKIGRKSLEYTRYKCSSQ